MGYPTAYRTSAAREQRQLSRPEPSSPAPPTPANDNRPRPFSVPKPANDNYRNSLPPRMGGWVKNPALKKVFGLAMQANPYYRAFRLGWDLYELYERMASVRTRVGEGLQHLCSVSVSSGCLNYNACQDSYCFGPVFFMANNNPLCGLAGQAHNGSVGVPRMGQFDGLLVQMLRPVIGSNGQQFCQPARVVSQFREIAFFPSQGRMRHMPYMVPWVETVPTPWAPARWYKPQINMYPGDPVDVTPEPPPFNMIPGRSDADMWPGTRGYEANEEAQAPRWEPTAFREPARPREKQAKFSGKSAFARELLFDAFKAHGKLKDFQDILGAFNDALPKELQLKGKDKKRLPVLLRHVWQNLEHLDGEKAILGVIKEIAEDVVGGFGDMLKTRAVAKFGWSKQKLHLSPRF